MTGSPTYKAHVEWDPIAAALSEVPKCKSWSPPWLPLINTILHVNDLFKMERVIVLLFTITEGY